MTFRELLLGKKCYHTPRHPVERLRWTFATLGVWIVNRSNPRPVTAMERDSLGQYAALMIDVLRGEVPFYGRDRVKPLPPPLSIVRTHWTGEDPEQEAQNAGD